MQNNALAATVILLVGAHGCLAGGGDTGPIATAGFGGTVGDDASADGAADGWTPGSADDADDDDEDDAGESSTTGVPGSASDAATDDTGTDPGTSTGGEPDVPVELVEVELSNVPDPCASSSALVPELPVDADFLVATVLTPPDYPFIVTDVGYELFGGGAPCNSTLPHLAYAFPIGGDLPASPSAGPGFTAAPVALDIAATDGRHVELAMEEPLRLEEGESIVVAVRLAVTAGLNETLCIATCEGAMAPGVDFWSNAAEEPYGWQDIAATYGLPNSIVSVTGLAPAP